MSGRLRILVGAVDIADVLPAFAEGFRDLGHTVTTVVRYANRFQPNAQYDIFLDDQTEHAGTKLRPRTQSTICVNRRGGIFGQLLDASQLGRLISTHDVFVFIWGGRSLTRGNREFPWLRRIGKKIVSVFMGSDIRYVPIFREQFSDIGFTADFLNSRPGDLNQQLHNIRVAERYSNVILSQPGQSVLGIRPYHHLFIPIQKELYTHHVPDNRVPMVLHIPSSRDIKGTALIVECFQSLAREGHVFDFRLLENTSNDEVREALRDADVVVDQLHLLTHGKLGCEAMLSGCAYATCNREDYEPIPRHRPILHIERSNLLAQLRRILVDRKLRLELAHKGRGHVTRFHTPSTVAERILKILASPNAVEPDHRPTYFARTFTDVGPRPIVSHKNRRWTQEILHQWGLPEGVDRGLLAKHGVIDATNKCVPESVVVHK